MFFDQLFTSSLNLNLDKVRKQLWICSSSGKQNAHIFTDHILLLIIWTREIAIHFLNSQTISYPNNTQAALHLIAFTHTHGRINIYTCFSAVNILSKARAAINQTICVAAFAPRSMLAILDVCVFLYIFLFHFEHQDPVLLIYR